jgi:hypothetical protein
MLHENNTQALLETTTAIKVDIPFEHLFWKPVSHGMRNEREISGKVIWDRTLLHTYMVFGSCWPLRTHPFRVIS